VARPSRARRFVLTLEGVREEGDAAHAEPGGGRLSGEHAGHLGLLVGRRRRIAAVLGRSGWVAVVGAEQALHPLLGGAPGGRAPYALSVGELGGVKTAPNRLAVDAVLGGKVSQARACTNAAADLLDLFVRELRSRWHTTILLRDSSRDSSRDILGGPRR
jgi:hypothetical protein